MTFGKNNYNVKGKQRTLLGREVRVNITYQATNDGEAESLAVRDRITIFDVKFAGRSRTEKECHRDFKYHKRNQYHTHHYKNC